MTEIDNQGMYELRKTYTALNVLMQSNAEFTLHDFQTRRIAVVFTLQDYLG